jgi:hypothetical protein
MAITVLSLKYHRLSWEFSAASTEAFLVCACAIEQCLVCDWLKRRRPRLHLRRGLTLELILAQKSLRSKLACTPKYSDKNVLTLSFMEANADIPLLVDKLSIDMLQNTNSSIRSNFLTCYFFLAKNWCTLRLKRVFLFAVITISV